MLSLERRYRLLLHAYPDAYREAHGDEIVATLLDAAQPGQIDPDLREAAWLVVAGLRTRARLAAEAGASVLWADGLRLTALLLLCMGLANTMGFILFVGSPRIVLASLLVAVAIAAVAAGATRVGLIALVPAALVSLSSHLPGTVLGNWWALVQDGLLLDELGAAAVLVWYTRRGGVRRPWPAWLGIVAVAIPILYGIGLANWGYVLNRFPGVPVSTFLELAPVLVLSAISLVANDPRPGIAAALFCVARLLEYAIEVAPIVASGSMPSGLAPFPLILMVMAVMAAVAGMIGSRRMQSAGV